MSLWLWFTVLFANFAEAVAEGRGKAQAASLRKMRKDVDGGWPGLLEIFKQKAEVP